MIPTLKMALNPIFVLIIITHAQVFECIKKHGGLGYLAAPYCRSPAGWVPKVTYPIPPSNLSLRVMRLMGGMWSSSDQIQI